MNPTNADSNVWLVSLASKKLGDDMEANSCSILEQALGDSRSTYAPMLFKMASRAG
jgi:hypothetical protein